MLPSCDCVKTLKFACAFVSPDNSGTFNLLVCSAPGTRNIHPVPLCITEQMPVLLMGLGASTALSSSSRVTVSWNLLHALETVLGDTANLLATAHIDGPSRRSWTACATSVGSRYRLMLPIVTVTQAKCKTVRKDEKNVNGLHL